MLPKKNRATKKAIEKIFKEGKFISSLNLTLKFLIEKKAIYPRISVIVPKTANKKAVIRNLLRRRMYAVLSKYIIKLPAGFLGVIIYSKKSAEIFGKKKNKNFNPIQNLEDEITKILNKIN